MIIKCHGSYRSAETHRTPQPFDSWSYTHTVTSVISTTIPLPGQSLGDADGMKGKPADIGPAAPRGMDGEVTTQHPSPSSAVSIEQSDAGRRLTNTYELLEMILLHQELPMETVFWSQGVNRQFRDTIATSKHLQQKLFLLPDRDPERVSDLPMVNPLFTKQSVVGRLPFFMTPKLGRCHSGKSVRLEARCPEVYPATEATDNVMRGLGPFVSWCMTTASDANSKLQTLHATSSVKGSWTHMCLSQPPSAVLCLTGLELASSGKSTMVRPSMDTAGELSSLLLAESIRDSSGSKER
ncbi:hypothetical protein LTR22_011320 [Elasticomyces elasticus]|nr:hypothetical protein LTR22_011320 [Elasticomyces elasticus]